MSLIFQNINPPPHPPLRPASVYPPPLLRAGGRQTRRAERGVGGQYFGRRETQDCPLTVIISLRMQRMFRLILRCGGRKGVLSAPHETRIFQENFDTWVGLGESYGGGERGCLPNYLSPIDKIYSIWVLSTPNCTVFIKGFDDIQEIEIFLDSSIKPLRFITLNLHICFPKALKSKEEE